ncbi:MAG TPA: hypothetical protein VHE35_28715 [Kofleriaceae bacterium]|nr:hypothetical protein [Kofleriaceae bacterium]
MRNSVLALALATLCFAGCMSTAHPAATRAETRFEIARAMSAEGGAPRSIVDLHEVDGTSAIVVTQPRDAAAQHSTAGRQTERWVHGADGWKFAGLEGAGADATAAGGPVTSPDHAD